MRLRRVILPSSFSTFSVPPSPHWMRSWKPPPISFMVKNFINNTHFFDWDEATYAGYFKGIPDAVQITIPKLPEMAAEQVDLASVSFSTFIANKKQSGDPASYSFVLRGYVRHWLDNVWAEYDRAGLVDVVEAKESARPTVARPRAGP